jgi:Flp pilus assembly protein TadG
MIKTFLKDTAGTFAIEVAIIAPILLLAFGQGTVIYQKMALKQNVAFVAQSAAAAGAAVLIKTGDQAQATARAQQVIDANAVLYHSFATISPPLISFSGGLIVVTIGASEPALFSVFSTTVDSEVTANA